MFFWLTRIKIKIYLSSTFSKKKKKKIISLFAILSTKLNFVYKHISAKYLILSTNNAKVIYIKFRINVFYERFRLNVIYKKF